MRTLLGCALAVAVCAAAPADDKDPPIDGKKLIGKWEPKEAKKDAKVRIEFAKDGKMTIAVEAAGKSDKMDGTYKLDGNKLKVKLAIGKKDIDQELTVLRLTDDEVETEDPKGKKETMVRIVGK